MALRVGMLTDAVASTSAPAARAGAGAAAAAACARRRRVIGGGALSAAGCSPAAGPARRVPLPPLRASMGGQEPRGSRTKGRKARLPGRACCLGSPGAVRW